MRGIEVCGGCTREDALRVLGYVLENTGYGGCELESSLGNELESSGNEWARVVEQCLDY